MQLFYLECPMRLDQHQLTLSKEILFKNYCGITIPIMCCVAKEILFNLSLKSEILLELCPC